MAALITAIAAIAKSRRAEQEVSALRAALTQHQTIHLTINQHGSTTSVGPTLEPPIELAPTPTKLPDPTPATKPVSGRRRSPRGRAS
ncbi:MAG: hypothetical protein AB7I13_01745 [Vicinamibacterales bacterium]